jgi:N-carbamoyl-L-amino-acid hydrolase
LGIPVLDLGSPASHDAAAFAAVGVPIGMIFIRNEGGSHNPREAMTIDDFLAGVSLLTHFLAEHRAHSSV